ncbi:MAG: hypothetical protein JRJ03_18695 [Deltaproteobacteria bacterium]|nr:hypothetical protein [Deltaproteobacteria bacterium]
MTHTPPDLTPFFPPYTVYVRPESLSVPHGKIYTETLLSNQGIILYYHKDIKCLKNIITTSFLLSIAYVIRIPGIAPGKGTGKDVKFPAEYLVVPVLLPIRAVKYSGPRPENLWPIDARILYL